MSVARCDTYDRAEVADAVARAVELAGGIARFVPKGGRALLKPNLAGPLPRERRALTDGEVVRAVANLTLAHGARVSVGDSPAVGPPSFAIRRGGILAALEGLDVEFPAFREAVERPGRAFPRLALAADAVGAGAIVNIAKLKTHAYMGLTLAVKNLFGCVPGPRKAQWHLRAGTDRPAFARMLADVAAAVPARLHLLDGVVGMEGNGPSSGTPRPFRVILASDDAAALDHVACRLVGFPPERYAPLAACRELGLGVTDAARIELAGDPLESFAVKGLKLATGRSTAYGIGLPGWAGRLLRGATVPRPRVAPERCTGCGRCVELCPPKAMQLASGSPPVIDHARCIRCFCCQEFCPEGAVEVREGWLLRLLGARRGETRPLAKSRQ